jgi:hypothetical protein
MTRRFEEIAIRGNLRPPPDRLPLVESHVRALMKSIQEVGLIEPIVVARKRHGIFIVAGFHRYEACRRLKLESIAAIVENEDSPEVERWQLLAEIDENLVRRDLTPAQRAAQIERRKTAYEAVHPETKQGGTKGAGRGKVAHKPANFAPAFVKDTALKTGKSTRAIELDATRAKRLGSDLARIANTSLDKGAELDALAAMPAVERAPIIARAAAGEQVSAIERDQPGAPQLRRSWAAFRAMWGRAIPAAREHCAPQFRAEFERMLAETATPAVCSRTTQRKREGAR